MSFSLVLISSTASHARAPVSPPPPSRFIDHYLRVKFLPRYRTCLRAGLRKLFVLSQFNVRSGAIVLLSR